MEQLIFPIFNDEWLALSTTTYEINRHGQVRRGLHILIPIKLKSGYEQITLHGNKRYVHRLMAKAFYGLPIDDRILELDHKDANRGNNEIGNLELISHQENCLRRGKVNPST